MNGNSAGERSEAAIVYTQYLRSSPSYTEIIFESVVTKMPFKAFPYGLHSVYWISNGSKKKACERNFKQE